MQKKKKIQFLNLFIIFNRISNAEADAIVYIESKWCVSEPFG